MYESKREVRARDEAGREGSQEDGLDGRMSDEDGLVPVELGIRGREVHLEQIEVDKES